MATTLWLNDGPSNHFAPSQPSAHMVTFRTGSGMSARRLQR
jgi:hypothetical protein